MTNVAPANNNNAPKATNAGAAQSPTKAQTSTFARAANTINGGPGNDDIKGTKGPDTINGGKGNDWISGGKGADTINGGNGHDTLKGGKGADTINGGNGKDTIHGGKGADIINGGNGADTINGGKGADTINGGNGKDWIEGGKGNDVINAGNGDDTIQEGKGKDIIDGGKGHDTVIYDGNSADYKISKNADGHTVVWSQAHGDDVLKNVETIKFNDKTVDIAPHNTINGTNGNDWIGGTDGKDIINAGNGNDVVHGGNGNDVIKGGNGNDWIGGGNGNDTINGGNGNDTINGGNGNDWIGGGNGNDTINGGNGNDWLFGGQGNDTLNGGAGHDTAVFSGNHADYQIISDKSANPSHIVVNKHTGERDVLKNIESIKFADKTITPGQPQPPATTWGVSEVKDGKADIKLGDRYSISLDEKNSVWILKDHQDHSSTRIWGDPHVDVGNDSKNDFDFKKNATFQLEDGTPFPLRGAAPVRQCLQR